MVERGVNYTEMLDRFNAVRKLGESAIELERQATAINEAIALLHIEPLVAPCGNAFTLVSRDDFDVAYSPDYKGPKEIYAEEFGRSDDGRLAWLKFSPDPHDPTKRPKLSPDGLSYLFVGNSVEYEDDTRTVWVYNKGRTIRARFEEGLELKGFIPDPDHSRIFARL